VYPLGVYIFGNASTKGKAFFIDFVHVKEGLIPSIAKHGNDGTEKWSTNTPCAVIQNAGGTRSDLGTRLERTDAGIMATVLPVQKVWRSTLGRLVSDIKDEDSTCVSVSPAVLVVGATAALDLLSQEF
jgi:siroheme synthase